MEREPSEEEPPAKRAKAEDEAPAAEDAPATEEAPAVEEGAAAETGATADAPAEEPAAEEAAVAPAADTPAAGQAGDAISDEELVELLKQRVEAKRMRDFATSDTIRTTLEGRGVHITDAKGQTQVGRWVALDGREGNTQGPDYFQKAPPAFGQAAALLVPQLAHLAALLRTASGLCGASHIPHSCAKAAHASPFDAQVPQPDTRNSLQAPPPPGYGGPGYGGAPPPPAPPVAGAGMISNDELVEMLGERAQAKVTRDYAKSDEIRTKLEAMGVKQLKVFLQSHLRVSAAGCLEKSELLLRAKAGRARALR